MAHQRSLTAPIQQHIDRAIDELIVSLPDPERLVPDERRGLIARYAAVLEGNFIYWMTAARLAVASDEANAPGRHCKFPAELRIVIVRAWYHEEALQRLFWRVCDERGRPADLL